MQKEKLVKIVKKIKVKIIQERLIQKRKQLNYDLLQAKHSDE